MYIFRLHRGDDLKQSILEFCRMNNINSGIIACAVGCCSKVKFRLAGAESFYEDERDYEIVSIMGTISKDGVHIHISFADDTGNHILLSFCNTGHSLWRTAFRCGRSDWKI